MPSHIVVCIKSVVLEAPKGAAVRTPENSELNPFDRPALEAALRLREAHGGTVTALTMGPAVSREALSEARALGVDRAVLVSDPALAESDTVVTARVLARAVQQLDPVGLLLFGTRTADSDTGQVGPQTATLLDLPFLSRVKHAELQGDAWHVVRTMDDWDETWQVRSPWAATIDARAYPPRPVGLVGITEASEDPRIRAWTLADLGLQPHETGLAGSPTRVLSMETVQRTRTCHMLEGEPQEQADALMERLVRSGLLGGS